MRSDHSIRSAMKFRLLFALVLFSILVPGRGAVLVSGFRETSLPLPGVLETTDIEWTPDTTQRLFLAQKNGVVRVMFQNGTLAPEPFATFDPVYTFSECGLVGMCFDPNFLINHYVYFFVTVSGSEQQILRCRELEGGGADVTVLVRGLPTRGVNHDGGGLAVGLDGKLYFSIGDLGNGVGVNADLTSLASKVGRCDLDGGAVVFNPFIDQSGPNNDYIWARGFRNPFKMAVQPTTGLMWVNVAGAGYEQIFAVDKGDHAGWNAYESTQPAGFIKPRVKYRTNGNESWQIANGGVIRHSNVVTITTVSQHTLVKGERIGVSGVFEPSFNGIHYVASTPSKTTFTFLQQGAHAVSTGGTVTNSPLGGAVTGGCFYNSTAFPSEYRQNYFFTDINSGRLNRVTLDATNEVVAVDYFANGIGGAVDAAVAPNGDLYYAGIGNNALIRLTSTNNPERIVVTPQFLNMAEGGTAVIHVRLTSPPAADVIMEVAKAPGNASISTTNVSLLFTPQNYAAPQPVFVQAAADADRAHSQAIFTLTCSGFPARAFTVNAFDPDHGQLAFSAVERTANSTRFQLATERRTRVALEGSSNLIIWQPFSTNLSATNTATLLDTGPVQAQRFYRARIVP